MSFSQHVIVTSVGQNVRTSNTNMSTEGMGAKLGEKMGAIDFQPRHLN